MAHKHLHPQLMLTVFLLTGKNISLHAFQKWKWETRREIESQIVNWVRFFDCVFISVTWLSAFHLVRPGDILHTSSSCRVNFAHCTHFCLWISRNVACVVHSCGKPESISIRICKWSWMFPTGTRYIPRGISNPSCREHPTLSSFMICSSALL